jgi:hypothetical protein
MLSVFNNIDEKFRARDPATRAFDLIRKMLVEAGKDKPIKLDKVYNGCERNGLDSGVVDE